MPHFTVAPLDQAQLAAAYALALSVVPDLSPEHWREFARVKQEQGGLLGLFAGGGELFGFLSYRIEESLRLGRVMRIDNFVTVELNRRAPGRRALCRAAEALAREKGCAAMELRLSSRGYVDEGSDRAQNWISLGHQLESVLFTKVLEPEAPINAEERQRATG